MTMTQLPIFSALAEKMRWHQTRQSLLAENVANAETPGFRGRDLKAFDNSDRMRSLAMAPVAAQPASASHIAISSLMPGDGFISRSLNNFEITPEGNGITLEDEMMKVTANQMDYQAVTSLYTRSMKIIKVALGRS
jgi:flagellar basal-body rod protein FlgB